MHETVGSQNNTYLCVDTQRLQPAPALELLAKPHTGRVPVRPLPEAPLGVQPGQLTGRHEVKLALQYSSTAGQQREEQLPEGCDGGRSARNLGCSWLGW